MSTKIEAPQTPQAPSTSEAVKAWVESLPQVYQAQLDYAPKEAAQQVDIAQQYALPMGEAYYAAQKAMYPETVALQEDLAKQAQAGMQEGVPDWAREQYLDEMRANLGTNIGSEIGADYTSRGLLEQTKGWQDYYRNLALSVAGRQPLTQAQSPGYSNYMSGFTPEANMGYMAQNYGNYSNAYSDMYKSNASVTSSMNDMYGKMAGGFFGGAGMALRGT